MLSGRDVALCLVQLYETWFFALGDYLAGTEHWLAAISDRFQASHANKNICYPPPKKNRIKYGSISICLSLELIIIICLISFVLLFRSREIFHFSHYICIIVINTPILHGVHL